MHKLTARMQPQGSNISLLDFFILIHVDSPCVSLENSDMSSMAPLTGPIFQPTDHCSLLVSSLSFQNLLHKQPPQGQSNYGFTGDSSSDPVVSFNGQPLRYSPRKAVGQICPKRVQWDRSVPFVNKQLGKSSLLAEKDSLKQF
eukprot:15365333-Ditylum_brightwellii.AAC.1